MSEENRNSYKKTLFQAVGHSSLACGSFSLPGHWRCACPWRPSLVRPGQTEWSLCPSRRRGGSELAAIEKYAPCREDIAEVAIAITAAITAAIPTAIPTAVAAVAATAVSPSSKTATTKTKTAAAATTATASATTEAGAGSTTRPGRSCP